MEVNLLEKVPIISLKNISISFNGHKILENFSLDIKNGEFVTFLGSSGCGKTTTLRIIAGFEKPDSGEILFSGKKINGAKLPQEKIMIG